MRWGRSMPSTATGAGQGGDDDLVGLLPAGDLADRVHRHRVDHLAVGLDPGLPEPVELVLQPPAGQGPGDPVGTRQHALEPAREPPVGGFGVGDGHDQVEAARAGVAALGQLGGELLAPEGLVGNDDVPMHDPHPFGPVPPTGTVASEPPVDRLTMFAYSG